MAGWRLSTPAALPRRAFLPRLAMIASGESVAEPVWKRTVGAAAPRSLRVPVLRGGRSLGWAAGLYSSDGTRRGLAIAREPVVGAGRA
jgi:hypothetical protein